MFCEKIEFENCKSLNNIEFLSEFRKVKEVKIKNCGDIGSIQVLRDAKYLEKFIAWESTNIVDGKVKFLVDIGVKIALRKRKHYDSIGW